MINDYLKLNVLHLSFVMLECSAYLNAHSLHPHTFLITISCWLYGRDDMTGMEFNRISWCSTLSNCSLPLVKTKLKCHFSHWLTGFFFTSSSFFQTLLVLSSLSAIALVISLLVVLSFLIHYCCCHRGDRNEGSEEEEEDEDGSTGHGYSGKKGRGICCVTWMAVAAVTLCWWEGGFRCLNEPQSF